MVVYSVGSKQSFDRVSHWLGQLSQKSTNPNLSIVLVGNKSDLDGDYREVTLKQGEDCAKELGLPFFETSAKEDKNCSIAFELLLTKVLDQKSEKKEEEAGQPDTPHTNSISLGKTQTAKEENSCC